MKVVILFLISLSVFAAPKWPRNIFKINNTIETIFLKWENEFQDINRGVYLNYQGPNKRSLGIDANNTAYISIERKRFEGKLKESVHFFSNYQYVGSLIFTRYGEEIKEIPNDQIFKFSFFNKSYNLLKQDFDMLRISFTWADSDIIITKDGNERQASMKIGERYTIAYFIERTEEDQESIIHWWNCSGCSGKKLYVLAREIDEDLWQFDYKMDKNMGRVPAIEYLTEQNKNYMNHLLGAYEKVFEALEMLIGLNGGHFEH